MKKFVAIGHIVNDLEPNNHIGGSVYYSAILARKLGYEVTIITKAPKNHPYIKAFENLGISVHLLPTKLSTITSFKNFYDENGRRTQFVTEMQELITSADTLPYDILKDSIILVASVIGEVDTSLFSALAKYGPLFATLQGYLRQVSEDGKVAKTFPEDLSFLKSVKATIFSEEDIAGDLKILNSIRENSKVTVVTRGESGSTVFEGNQELSVPALALSNEEIHDLTGAGDTFAAAFILEYMKTLDLKLASEKANLMAGLKISQK